MKPYVLSATTLALVLLGAATTFSQDDVYPLPKEPAALVTLKTYWSAQRQEHILTASAEQEKAVLDTGYKFVRDEGRVLAKEDSGKVWTARLKLYWNVERSDNYSTATEEGERSAIAGGYKLALVQGYASPKAYKNLVPLKSFWNGKRGDSYTTASEQGEKDALAAGYKFVRIEGYVFPPQDATSANAPQSKGNNAKNEAKAKRDALFKSIDELKDQTPPALPDPPEKGGRVEYAGKSAGGPSFIMLIGIENGQYVLSRIDPDGKNRKVLVRHKEFIFGPAASPDGKRVAYSHMKSASETQVLDVAADGSGGGRTLASQPGAQLCGYSPDGKRILLTAIANGSRLTHIVDADGSNARVRATEPRRGDHDNGPAYSPDGKRILFSLTPFSDPRMDLYTANADGSNPTRLTNLGRGHSAQWSPDGKQIAMVIKERDNLNLLHVMNADGSGLRKISDLAVYGGCNWSADGRRILFLTRKGASLPYQQALHSVAADGSDFKTILGEDFNVGSAYPSPDGKWLLVRRMTGETKFAGLYIGGPDGKDMRKLIDLDYIEVAAWSPGK